MHPTVVNTALLRPWPHVEAIVADRLGLRPQDIWPSRYDADGKPLKGGTRWRKNHSAPIDSEHFQKREAA